MSLFASNRRGSTRGFEIRDARGKRVTLLIQSGVDRGSDIAPGERAGQRRWLRVDHAVPASGSAARGAARPDFRNRCIGLDDR